MQQCCRSFCFLHQAFCDANANVPSTVGRALEVLLGIINNASSDECYVASLNRDVEKTFDELQEAEESLAGRGTELVRYLSEVTSVTGELNKSVDGRQAPSLAARHSHIAKVSKLGDLAILELAT